MSKNLVPYGMDANGQWGIGNKDVDIFNGLPVLGTSPSTPTISLGSAAGSSATVSIVGSNLAGKITLVSGTGILTSGTVLTLTFGGSFAYPNGCAITFASGNTNFSTIQNSLSVATTISTVVLSISIGLSLSTTYIGYYHVVGW